MPITPVARLVMALSELVLYAVGAMIPDRLRQVRFALRVLLLVAAVMGLAGAAAAQQPVQTPLLVMISIDGLRPDYVTAADAHGARIPNLRRFLREGAFAQGVVGVIPTVTYPSHTTLITGVSPAAHGIFANTTFDPLRENQGGWYWYSEDIRVATLWDAAARAGLSTASVQWPASVGARVTWNIPEFWRSGASDDAKLLRAVSTPGLLAELEPELGLSARAHGGVGRTSACGTQCAFSKKAAQPADAPSHRARSRSAREGTVHGEDHGGARAPRHPRGHAARGTRNAGAGGAYVAIVSDHGFGKTTKKLNLMAELRATGLVTVSAGKVTDWKAMPWTAGGAVAVVLKDPADAATLATVRALLDRLAADPAHGIDRVLDAAALRARGGCPTAAFVVGLRPDWHTGSSLTGPLVGKATMAGMHGHLPDLPDLHAAFFVVGPDVPAGRALGLIDMRDIATTLARRLNLSLPAAEGKELWP
jgi:hypothetical protein